MSLPFGTLFAAVKSATGAQLDNCFQQTPCLVASNRVTGQTAAVANLFTYPVGAADATFLLQANALITTSVNFAIILNIAYTDEGGTPRTVGLLVVNSGNLGAAMVNANGAIPYAIVPTSVRAKAETNIVVSSSGSFVNVVYNFEAMLYQLK